MRTGLPRPLSSIPPSLLGLLLFLYLLSFSSGCSDDPRSLKRNTDNFWYFSSSHFYISSLWKGMPKIALAGLGPAHILSMASSWRTTALRHATFAAILALVRFGPNRLGDDYDFCHETSCKFLHRLHVCVLVMVQKKERGKYCILPIKGDSLLERTKRRQKPFWN